MNSIPTGSEYMKGRQESARELAQGLQSDDWEAREEAQEALDTFALSVEVERHVRIVLGTGGPHDELDVTLWPDGNIREVRYLYAWGSERFETKLDTFDPLWSIAESYAEYATLD